MARYRRIDTGLKLLPVDLSVQLLPGTFEHALSHLVDHELDLSRLDSHFRNDDSGAPAYSPSVMLKVILYAYSRGDDKPQEPGLVEKQTQRVERLQKDAAQLREWLKENPEDRKGAKGSIRKSNRTDNESAKMATSKA